MRTTGERPGFEAICDGATAPGLDPGELLARFAATRDEAAFAALVAIHGPMVLATCRRIIPHRADADDAFQATFLVLARRAWTIHNPDRLAPWLHRVARHVALRARKRGARRRVEGLGHDEVPATDPPADPGELRSVLDEELARLPEKYRAPLVLCYLEGLTHDEAAGRLRWPVGTVRSRLAGGRDRLRGRLARRGFAPGSIPLPAPLPLAAVAASLRAATVRLALSAHLQSAAPAAALAQGALTAMLVTKVQSAAVVALAAAATLAAGTAGVVLARQQPAPRSAPRVNPSTASVAPGDGTESPEEELYRRDQELKQLGSQAARATGQARADLDEKLMQATQRFWSARLNGQVADNYSWEMTGVPGKLQLQIGQAEVAVKELIGELDVATGRVKALRAELSAWQAKHQPSESNVAAGTTGVATARQPPAADPKAGPPNPAAEPTEVAALNKARVKALEAELARRDEEAKVREARAKALDGTVEVMRDAASRLGALPEPPKGVPERGVGPEERPEAPRPASEAQPPTRPVQPEPAPTIETLKGSPTILMAIPAARDRVTMIDLRGARRSTLRLGRPMRSIRAVVNQTEDRMSLDAAATPQQRERALADGLIGLELVGERVETAAVFDRVAMRWFEHPLPRPAARVRPDMTSFSTLIGFGVQPLEPTAELLVFDARDRTWPAVPLPAPVAGFVPADVSIYGTVTFEAGRFLAVYSQAARKAGVVKLARSFPTRGPGADAVRRVDAKFLEFQDRKLIIPDGDLIRLFDPRTAEWRAINTDDEK